MTNLGKEYLPKGTNKAIREVMDGQTTDRQMHGQKDGQAGRQRQRQGN